ncbi:sucrase-isomaltase, intestinal-like [Molothrus aeneus]|uniref:sucrase-isomaltase, intestinal-like n=1 Tax=Molothrus aeneus TaxID=84833 RepID=UPI003459E1BD
MENYDTYEKGEFLLMSFTARPNLLELRVLHDGYKDPNSLKFTQIKILGFSGAVGEVTVTSGSAPVPGAPKIEHDPQKKVLKISQLELELGRNYTLKWG